MAQPSTQVLLDSGKPNHAATSFWYANDTGLWDAKAGAMLAKTGTAGLASEGGANVVLGNGSTYYALPSAISLGGDFTLLFKARTATNGSTASMVCGSRSNTANFVWLASSATNITVRANTNDVALANSNSATMAHYALVRDSSGFLKLYKNGALVGSKAQTQTLTISHILSGYTGTSFIHNGALEFMHIINGVAMDAAAVSGYYADPYQDLIGAAGDTTPPTLSAASATAISATTASGGVTTTEAGMAWAVLTTSITTPTAAQIKAGENHTGAAASSADTATLSVGANASAFAFTTLTAGETYYLHATQDDTATPANTATPVTSASITTPAPDTTPPVLMGTITLVSNTENTINVSSPTGSDNVAVVAYEWSRDGGSTWIDDDTTRTFTALTGETLYPIRVRARDAAGNVSTPALALDVTTNAAPAGTIILTSPTAYQSRQRDLATDLSAVPFTISGTYTGTATSIEYRFAGGAWQTLIASPSGGTFSTTLALPTGQGAFEVRFGNSPAITTAASFVTVGDGFASAGQSNACGRAAGVVAPVASNFTATKLGRDGVWKPLTEANTRAGSFDEDASARGSFYGALSNHLQARGVPVFFIPCALGGVGINEYARYGPIPDAPATLYGDVFQAHLASGGLRAIIFYQGETDAANGSSQAAYTTALNTLVNNWWADLATKTFVVKICRWSPSSYTKIDAIRAAQQDVIDTNPNAAGGADANVWTRDDVHYGTTAEVQAVADAVYVGMVDAFYDVRCTLTLTTNGTTPAASQTGISWAWYDAAPPNLAAAPVQSGTEATTNASGVFDVALPSSTLTIGQTGTLLAVKSDGAAGSVANSAFCAPVVVS